MTHREQDFQFRIVSLQDAMDDIAEGVGGQALVNLFGVANDDMQLPEVSGDFVLNMASDSHGMGVFPDGTRFDVYVHRIEYDIAGPPKTRVDIGLHMDMRMIESGGVMITAIHDHFEKIVETDQVLPANVRTDRNHKARADATRDQNGRPLEPQVAAVRKTVRATEYIAHQHTPVHGFG